jgi:hypothetical protein
MVGDLDAGYLAGLPADLRAGLERVNGPGLAALRGSLALGEAVAFLGAGVSVPLYPLWNALIGELVEAAAGRLTEPQAATCRALASANPEEVVEIVRRNLGSASYREVLREVLRARTDPVSGRSWTPAQELVCRCAFKGVVTTNFDSGIVDARMRVRPGTLATGFTAWDDELGLDRWRTGKAFGDVQLPVLYAHGQCNRPDSVVLATGEYRRAYEGKLAKVLERLVDGGHLVWIGFSFADQRIAAILREVAQWSGTRAEPGAAPGHVAIMPWDPEDSANDPGILAQRAEISYGARVVLYPAPGDDHSALLVLLETLTDPRFPPVGDLPVRADSQVTIRVPKTSTAGPDIPVRWEPEPEPAEHFTGRVEELARLDRWAADPQVALVGVTAWGGAGKTALVTHWVQEGGASQRADVRWVFGWSFYVDPSAEHWAEAVLEMARQDLGIVVASTARPTVAVLELLRAVPLLLVLDGLEVAQQDPAGDEFGRLLDGTLREVLAGACQQPHGSLVVLTSRFPFADLEAFDGGSARMLEVPPFTPAEGSVLLGAAGGGWLAEDERRDLVAAVDGHALAVSALAGLLANRPPESELAALRDSLAEAARTDTRVGKVLQFYGDRLAEPGRYLLAAVSLFARAVSAETVLTVAGHEVFGARLAGWTPAMVRATVRTRLAGLASWHADGTVSAHPLVRDTFRRLVMDAAAATAETALAGMPEGRVTSRADALRMVEAIELLLDAGQWRSADDIFQARSGSSGRIAWVALPAARLGQRAATAFAGTPARREACAAHLGARRLDFYTHSVGVWAMNAGDMVTARKYLLMAVRNRDAGTMVGSSRRLRNLAECLGHLGEIASAQAAAGEALTTAQATGDLREIRMSHVYVGWLAALAGDTTQAEQQFIVADQIEMAVSPKGSHLYSLRGAWWADWLARTGRLSSAIALTSRNHEICRQNGWRAVAAWCDRQLGRLALAAGDTAAAGQHLMAAAECFRDGGYLTELTGTLAYLAEHARVIQDFEIAERHAAEAISIAGPRGLVAAQSAALAARARIRASQAAADPDLLYQGRDAADAALRLATRHNLAWHELDALRAHATLDQAEAIDSGWAAKADALHDRLVPKGLDPDPLATVERLIAEQKAAEERPGST